MPNSTASNYRHSKNDAEPAPAFVTTSSVHPLLGNTNDVVAAENLRCRSKGSELYSDTTTNDAEPAPKFSMVSGVYTPLVSKNEVDAAENLRSRYNSTEATSSSQTDKVAPAPEASLLTGKKDVDKVRSRLHPASIAARVQESEAAPAYSTNPLIELSLSTAAVIQDALEADLLREEVKISYQHKAWGLQRMQGCNDSYSIDKPACRSLSDIIRARNLDVGDTVRFLRGETARDSRPNKALDVSRLTQVLAGYPHLEELVKIATHGIEAQWSHTPTARRPPPKNHGSCRRNLRAVTKSIREGQDCGQYLVVEGDILSCWPSVICSPLGAVEKKDVDPSIEVRTIHDLSYPRGDLTNSSYWTDSVSSINYEPITKIAQRIVYLASYGDPSCIRMLKGDVKGAFRHLRTCASQVFRMAAFVKELNILLIDMAAPFGWSGSPSFYSLFGRAISWLVSTNSPASVSNSVDNEPFFGYEWVDDHILVELDVGDRLLRAEATLRHAMLAVLGSRSINEAKFSEWSSELVALGLLWNTTHQTVSIPDNKVIKALKRVTTMLTQQSATKTELQKLLGSLRHVAICFRTCKPFYQRLHSALLATSRFAKTRLSEGALCDLQWFRHILAHGHLSALPVSMFGGMPSPDVTLYMDSSNIGLAVLDPAVNKFIQLKFDSE